MHRWTFRAAAALALLSSGPLLAVQTKKVAATSCVTNAEMHAGVAYFLPEVLVVLGTKCAAAVPADGYIRTGMPRLIDDLRAGKPAAWPLAKSAFIKMSGKSGSSGKVSDEVLRAMADEMFAQQLLDKIDAATCGEVDDILGALAPLNVEQTVHFVATVFNAAARSSKNLRSCPRGS